MAEKTLIQLGKKVPNFTLKDQNGADFTLSGCVGKKVLLSFHPLACNRTMYPSFATLRIPLYLQS